MAADEGWIGRGRVALNNKAAVASVVAHEDVFVIAEVGVVAVLDPLLLYKLKLAGEAGVECHEDHAAIVRVCDRLIFCREGSVRQTAARDAATIDESSIEAERIAGMDTPDVRAHGTARSCRIGSI